MSLEIIQHLFSLSRFKEAEAKIKSALTESPNDALLHAYLSMCFTATDRFKEAIEEADIAISLYPENDFFYFVKGKAYFQDDKYDKAEKLFQEALSIAPHDSDYYLYIAQCKALRDDIHGAFPYSEKAMEYSPDDEDVVNFHISLLNQLGKKEEADELIEQLLYSSPDNSDTHKNKGWYELKNKNRKAALEHFKESLRIDPENEGARLGLIQTIKAGNPIYSLLLSYGFWMQRLKPSTRWIIVLVAFISIIFASRLRFVLPEYSIYINPFIFAYLFFAFSTWCAAPLTDLLLFLHPLGKNALKPNEKKICLMTSFFLLSATVSTILYLFDFHPITLPSFFFSLLMVPLFYGALSVDNKKHSKILLGAFACIFTSGVISLVLIYLENIIGIKLFNYTQYGWIAFFFLQGHLTQESI